MELKGVRYWIGGMAIGLSMGLAMSSLAGQKPAVPKTPAERSAFIRQLDRALQTSVINHEEQYKKVKLLEERAVLLQTRIDRIRQAAASHKSGRGSLEQLYKAIDESADPREKSLKSLVQAIEEATNKAKRSTAEMKVHHDTAKNAIGNIRA